jgi:hypothetical protein
LKGKSIFTKKLKADFAINDGNFDYRIDNETKTNIISDFTNIYVTANGFLS